MSSKSHGVSVSPGTILCVLCLLLYSAGFIRIELKSSDHEERLVAVEKVISHMNKHGMIGTSTKDSGEKEVDDKETLQRFIKSFANKAPFNNSANITEVLENIITSSFNKICRNTGDWNVQTASEPVTTPAPTTALPMCPMPERPVQLTGVMGFGLDLNSHAAYTIKKGTPFYKLIGSSTRLIFDFRASNPNGIMLYTANPTQLDFIVCHLEDGKVACSFSAGYGILKLITTKATYSDGNWHTVRLLRQVVRGTLYVDDKRVDYGLATGSARYINGLETLFLGGVPKGFDSRQVPAGSRMSLPGCIRNVTVNHVDIGKPAALFKMQDCYRNSPESGVSFGNGGGHLKVANAYTVGETKEISLDIKPTSHTGLLLLTQNRKGDYLVLEMKLGNIIIRVENGGGELVAEFVAEDLLQFCDEKWHTIKVWKSNNVVSIQVDDNPVIEGEKKGTQTSTDILDPLYVGGAPDGKKAKGVTVEESYTGCMRNLVSKDPNGKPQKLSLTNPLMVTGNVYLGGCPYK